MTSPLSASVLPSVADVAKIPRHKQTRAWVWGRQTWLGDTSRATKKFWREMSAWMFAKRIMTPSLERLTESAAIFGHDKSSRLEPERDAPIFLLSTGWRAGSTLLQRIFVTDERLLLWGEPLGEMAIAARIADMVGHFISPALVNEWAGQANVACDLLATSWIANLYPSPADFRNAVRGLFDQWLAKPAADRGFLRWGFKEVRLGGAEASLLRWLYPHAKFVLIHRHPFHAYKSLADSQWQFYYRYPDVPIKSAVSFARLWNELVMSWSKLPPEFPCFRIKYEELVSGKVNFRDLETYLGIKINENLALSASIGGTAKRKRLTWYERMIIGREAAEGMHVLGYNT